MVGKEILFWEFELVLDKKLLLGVGEEVDNKLVFWKFDCWRFGEFEGGVLSSIWFKLFVWLVLVM